MLLKMKLHLVLIMQNILLCYSKEHISEEILDLLQELDIKDVFFGSDCPKCWNQINLFKTFFQEGSICLDQFKPFKYSSLLFHSGHEKCIFRKA